MRFGSRVVHEAHQEEAVSQQHRALSKGLLIAGLLLPPLGFLVSFGNAWRWKARATPLRHWQSSRWLPQLSSLWLDLACADSRLADSPSLSRWEGLLASRQVGHRLASVSWRELGS